MRAFTAQETKVFAVQDGYQVRTRVSIKDSGGTFRDYTALEGYNWIASVDWDEDVDQPVGSATVRLWRQMQKLSLPPLMSGKLSGYLDVAREIKIETACIPFGAEPASTDWLLAFHGYIESIDWSGDPMTIECFDLGRKLQLAFIEAERTYSNATGTAVQTVMQSIIDDTLGASVVTLYTPVSPAWNIKGYQQKKEPILDALTTLAAQIGWDVRYKYDSGTSAYRLTLYQPDRTKVTPDLTLAANRYLDVKQLSVSRADVRNAVQVVYLDRATLTAAGLPTRTTTSTTDATSITKYGRQWMEITEGASSNIDTATEANKMRDAALADLKDPKATQEIELHLLPNIELGDLIRFTANNVHYTSDQDLAVVRVAHSISPDEARTTVMTRGKPTGPRDQWFQMETKPGVAPTVRLAGPEAPTSVAVTTVAGGAAITFKPPIVGNWDAFELHQSTTNGFTPDYTSSSTTFKALSDSNRFEVSDLVPGATYYWKVVPVDPLGNRGTASSQVSIAAGYVRPLDFQPRVNIASLITNAEFEANNVASSPPDTWTFSTAGGAGGVWGTDALVQSTTAYSGVNAVKFPSAGKGTLVSEYFVAREGQRFSFDFFAQWSASATVGTVLLKFFDSSLTSLGSIGLSSAALVNANTWTRINYIGDAPSGTKYARVEVAKSVTGTDFYIDSCLVQYASTLQEVGTGVSSGPGFAAGWSNWTDATYYTPRYFKDANGFVHLSGLALFDAGAVGAGTLVFTLPTGYRPSLNMIFSGQNSSGQLCRILVLSDGRVIWDSNRVSLGWHTLSGIYFDTTHALG